MHYISNIQRFSLDDGPGIRTTIFFKGCNLQCKWCHNPECISADPLLQFTQSSCTSCQKCAIVCPQQVHHFTEEGNHLIDFHHCVQCGACVQHCPNAALSINGTYYKPEDLLTILKKDAHYYEKSAGGITFSGGEPMLQVDYLVQILKLCKSEGFHTAIDTAGNVPFSCFEQVLPYTDLFLYDIKFFSEETHRLATGVSNHQIKTNLQKLNDHGATLYIRTPVIAEYHTDLKEFQKIADFLAPLHNIQLVQLLPYHNYGLGKYASIGLTNQLKNHIPPTQSFMEEALQIYLQAGLPAQIS